MALHWDVGKIADCENVTTSPVRADEWHPVTHALIMHSMVLGYGQITEKNYREIAQRWAQYQLALDPVLGYQLMPKLYITEEDVRLHIGLSINVAWLTANQWNKKLVEMITRECGSIADGRRNRRNLPIEFARDGDPDGGMCAHEVVDRAAYHYKMKEVSNGQDNS